jgi:hypothetical protein
MQVNENGGSAVGQEAVDKLAQITIERERTRRLLIFAAVGCILAGTFAILVAPPEKEVASYIVGAVMCLLALGAIGASSFKLKAPGIEISKTNAPSADSRGGWTQAE